MNKTYLIRIGYKIAWLIIYQGLSGFIRVSHRINETYLIRIGYKIAWPIIYQGLSGSIIA
jgi:hypothetical protein